MSILNKLFGNKKKKNQAITDLAGELFVGSLASAEGSKELWDEGKAPTFRMTSTLCSGLIGVADRLAFTNIPEQRAQVIDQLVEDIAKFHVSVFIDGKIKLNDPMSAMINELNKGHAYLGQFTQFQAESGQQPKGTFMWEFGKRFAEDVEKPEDIVIANLGMDLLTSVITQVKIKDKILEIKG